MRSAIADVIKVPRMNDRAPYEPVISVREMPGSQLALVINDQPECINTGQALIVVEMSMAARMSSTLAPARARASWNQVSTVDFPLLIPAGFWCTFALELIDVPYVALKMEASRACHKPHLRVMFVEVINGIIWN